MKRDDDLIRSMLLELEAEPPTTGYFIASEFNVAGFSSAVMGEHGVLLIEAGWVSGSEIPSDDGPDAALKRLTMDGHDFLAAIRDETVWAKTKKRLAPVGGGTIDVIKGIAIAVISETLKGG